MKKKFLTAAAAAALYLALLTVLVTAEARDPTASIRGFWDGFWYSLVTLTTVGYGDLFPVTPVGRLVGVILVLCSLGLLTALFSVAMAFLQGRMLPRMWLSRRRDAAWYVFDKDTQANRIFCGNLLQQDPAGVILFLDGGTRDRKLDTPFGTCILWAGSLEELLLFHGEKGKTELFFLDDDGSENFRRASDALGLGCPVYCGTEVLPETVPERMTLFHPTMSLGRRYWQQNPIRQSEKCVVLIGCGAEGSALLEQGLMNNIRPEGRLQYHVFGDSSQFRALHYRLEQEFAVNRVDTDRDSLLFYEDTWQDHPELLSKADRIIFCMDSEEDNLQAFGMLRRYYVTAGTVFLRLQRSMALEGGVVFGTADSLLTPDLVMRQEQNRLARRMHEIYRRDAAYPVPSWEELTEFMRQSNMAAADHLPVKIRLLLGDDTPVEITPELCMEAYRLYCAEVGAGHSDTWWELEHRRWVRFHNLHNWSFASKTNKAAREHCLMVPYHDLSEEERRKDDYAWSLLAALGGEG